MTTNPTTNPTNDKNNTSDVKRHKAVVALLTHPEIKSAAEAAGVSERTLHRWLKEDPSFWAELRAAEAEALDSAVRRLTGSLDDAVTVLCTIMLDPEASAGIRLRAVGLLLDQVIRFRELYTLEQRMAKLEWEQEAKSR